MAAHITIVGRLTSDPELKHLDEDKTVCEIRVAYNQNRGQSTGYINIHSWGSAGEQHAKYLAKGHLISASGELQFQQNKTADRTYTNYTVVNPHLEYLAKPRNGTEVPGGHTPDVEDGEETPF